MPMKNIIVAFKHYDSGKIHRERLVEIVREAIKDKRAFWYKDYAARIKELLNDEEGDAFYSTCMGIMERERSMIERQKEKERREQRSKKTALLISTISMAVFLLYSAIKTIFFYKKFGVFRVEDAHLVEGHDAIRLHIMPSLIAIFCWLLCVLKLKTRAGAFSSLMKGSIAASFCLMLFISGRSSLASDYIFTFSAILFLLLSTAGLLLIKQPVIIKIRNPLVSIWSYRTEIRCLGNAKKESHSTFDEALDHLISEGFEPNEIRVDRDWLK
jgi:hypothetical protein